MVRLRSARTNCRSFALALHDWAVSVVYVQFGVALPPAKRGPGVAYIPGKSSIFQCRPVRFSYRNPMKCNSDALENDHFNVASLPFL